jgi:hypothetical protein
VALCEVLDVWSDDIWGLFGCTLAATLSVSYGLNGWAVVSGILLAGLIAMSVRNLVGEPSVEHGLPHAMMAPGTVRIVLTLAHLIVAEVAGHPAAAATDVDVALALRGLRLTSSARRRRSAGCCRAVGLGSS